MSRCAGGKCGYGRVVHLFSYAGLHIKCARVHKRVEQVWLGKAYLSWRGPREQFALRCISEAAVGVWDRVEGRGEYDIFNYT
jgi:hypothetical protein